MILAYARMTATNHMSKLTTYIIGFVLSVILTLLSYFVVVNHMMNGTTLLIFILSLAIIQLFVQLIFFLHLSQKPEQRLNIVALLSAVSVILLIVIGSLWIMNHLNYNMTPRQMNNYIIKQDGF